MSWPKERQRDSSIKYINPLRARMSNWEGEFVGNRDIQRVKFLHYLLLTRAPSY
jgi:hypothetical protein